MAEAKHIIPTGTLRQLTIADITVGQRFRENLGDVQSLAESIREKGVLQPITVSTDMNLLAGGRRIHAAQMAGLLKIPALVRKTEDTLDAREIELMENVFRKDFEWHEENALIEEIDRMYKERHIEWVPREGGGMQPGWSGRKTAELLHKSVSSVQKALELARAVKVIPELMGYKTADDARKVLKQMEEQVIIQELRKRQDDPSNPTINKGIKHVLDLANRNYIIGDTFKGLAELRSGGSVHLIECDPPYGINLTQQKRSKDSVGSTVHGYEEVDADDYPAFINRLAAELFRVANKDCWLVFWFGPTWQHEVLIALRSAGWFVDDIPCIWVKDHGQTMVPETYLGRAYEPFYMARKGAPILMKRGRLNVFHFSGATQKYHPTERPVPLIEEILSTLATPVSTVLVPFLGSGATIRAAYNLGMKVSGWDIDPKYKDNFLLAIEQDARALDLDEC